MTTRDYLVSGLILIVLVLVLAWANIYYIQPNLTPKLTKPEKLPAEATYTAPIDKNIVATTLEKIKKMFAKKESPEGFQPRQVQRNPFFWPDEMVGEKYVKAPSEGKEEGKGKGLPRLNMILIGENRKIALINDRLVFEGTPINGDKVQSIEEKEVILRGDTGETRLSLAEYTIAPAKEEVAAPPEALPQTPAQEETIESLYEKLKPLLNKP